MRRFMTMLQRLDKLDDIFSENEEVFSKFNILFNVFIIDMIKIITMINKLIYSVPI